MMLALVKPGLRNSWILTAGNPGTSCFIRHLFLRKLQKITKDDTKFHKNKRKMPKIDTLDALEEHEEHEDDYQTISN